MRVVIEVDGGVVIAAYADGDVEFILIDHDVGEIDVVGVNTSPSAMAEVQGRVKYYKKPDREEAGNYPLR